MDCRTQISILIGISCFFFGPIIAIKNRDEKTLVDDLLKEYDKTVRPSSGNGTKVHVSMYLRHISSVNSKDMDMESQITFRQRWNDPRLAYDNVDASLRSTPYVTLPSNDLVWKPDTFFRNSKRSKIHNDLASNDYLRLFPNGDLLYSTRMTLKTVCLMNYRLFPFDSHTCQIQIASYGCTSDDLEYEWKESDPIQIVSSLHLPEFSLQAINAARCDVRTATGKYSCLSAEYGLERLSWPAFKACYFPLTALVVLSWTAFWIPIGSASAGFKVRSVIGCALGISVLMVCLFGYGSPNPAVAYSIAIDEWKTFCFMITWLAFIETICVNYLMRAMTSRSQIQAEPSTKISSLLMALKKPATWDLLTKVAFPTVFVVYAITYYSIISSAREACDSSNGVKCLY